METTFASAAKQQAAATAALTATTWNGAVSHSTTSSARVDFFSGSVRGVTQERFAELLEASYEEDALHTLKLIAYIRDCRGGKGERQLGRFALEWLATKHPRELAHNLKFYVDDFGRFDDVIALMNTPVETEALELLSRQLKSDLEKISEKDGDDSSKGGISLCAKWIPSENKSLDRKLQVNKKLSLHMGLSTTQLRKQYLSPLRAKLRILERFMCSNDWENINLNAVPSVAMHIHGRPKHAFERHLGEKYSEWKSFLKTGETKVNAKALFPHQVVGEYLSGRHSVPDELLEAQWKVLVEEAAKMGSLEKTVVLSDVSASMYGVNIQISIAMGLLVSALARDEYKDLVLTFESTSRFHHVVGDSLMARVEHLKKAPWGGSTNFSSAFREVLRVAKEHKLKQDQMPERLIVVSDMQFDSADGNFETNYETLKRDFQDAGYCVPHLVFWNVNGSTRDFPTYSGAASVSLVSGFSTAILKSVLTGNELTPLQTMLNVVMDERYDCITIPPHDDCTQDIDGVLL